MSAVPRTLDESKSLSHNRKKDRRKTQQNALNYRLKKCDVKVMSQSMTQKQKRKRFSSRKLLIKLAPQVRLELTTLRLTAECSAIELLRNNGKRPGFGRTLRVGI